MAVADKIQTNEVATQGVNQSDPSVRNEGMTQDNAVGGGDQIHKVVRGDNLSKIATKYNVPGGYQALAAYNGIKNASAISVGQEIKIPSGSGASVPQSQANIPAPVKVETSAEAQSVDAKPAEVQPIEMPEVSQPSAPQASTEKFMLSDAKLKDAKKWYESGGGAHYQADFIKQIQGIVSFPQTGEMSDELIHAIGAWQKTVFTAEKDIDGKFAGGSAGKAGLVVPKKSANSSAGSSGGTGKAEEAITFAKNKKGSLNYYNADKKMTYCQGFVADCALAAVKPRHSKNSAKDAQEAWKVSTSLSDIPRGAAVYFNSTTTNGAKYGHVGLHIGDNKICHVTKAVVEETLSHITRADSKFSFNSWGWNGGIELTD